MTRNVSFKDAVVINFKVYEQTTGDNAVKMALMCDAVAEETGANVIIAVQNTDLDRVTGVLGRRRSGYIPVLAQHVDPLKPGKGTGRVTVEALKANGADGVLLNHSEDKLVREGSIEADVESNIKPRVELCKTAGLATLVCSGFDDNKAFEREARAIASLPIDAIAPEPPSLIGGDVSVTTKEQEVRILVAGIKKVNLGVKILLGAGVKKGEHVRSSIEYGAHGALLASGVDAPLAGKGDLQGERMVGKTRPLTLEGLKAAADALVELVSGVKPGLEDKAAREDVVRKALDKINPAVERLDLQPPREPKTVIKQ